MPVFVNINLVSGADDGSSWGNAYRGPTALQKALGISPSSNDEIWVAKGTYLPSQGWDVINGVVSGVARTESFRIPDSARVYGGFAGNETIIEQRDVAANPTILSGDIGIIEDPSDNAYHVVFFYQVSSSTILDGFTITEGIADGMGSGDFFGGGIFNNGIGSPSNPTIISCMITCNEAALGGAVANLGENGDASPIFNSCLFSENLSESFGGAVYNNGINNGNSSPRFNDCVFENNQAINGGAISNEGPNGISSPSFYNCIFSENNSDRGGAVLNNAADNGNASPTFVNCVFTHNNANEGGAVYNIAESGNSSPTFVNVTFFNNSATNAGTIMYNLEATPTTTNSILWNDFGTNPSLIEENQSTTTLSFSDVLGGWSGPGTNNIDSDPLFINPSNPIGPDNIWMTSDDGLVLQPCSPCISAGTPSGAPTMDIIDNVRPSPPSMGAYEREVFTIVPAFSTVLCNDNEGTISVTGLTDVSSLLWQLSEDGGVSWRNTDNLSPDLTFINLSTATEYRVQITTEDCTIPVFSNIAIVNVEGCPAPDQVNFISTIPVESIEVIKIYDWAVSSNNASINVDFE